MHTRPRTFALKPTPLDAPDPAPDQLVPVVVLPAQLPWGFRRDSQTSGPLALRLAVLEDAIRCLLAPGGPRRLARDAEDWIRADDHEWPMSFHNVCEALGIEPGKLREALLARGATGGTTVEASGGPWSIKLRRGRGGSRRIALARRWALAS